MQPLTKARKIQVMFAEGLEWADPAYLYQEKADGEWLPAPVRAMVRGTVCELVAEWIPEGKRRRSGGSALVVHDVLSIGGADVRQQPRRVRWAELLKLAPGFEAGKITACPKPAGPMRLCRWADVMTGGEFLRRITEAGAEGVCAHALDLPFGADFYAAKRLETYQCRVTGFCGGSQSVTVADAASGAPRGRVPLRGGKCDQVRTGSVLKVEGMGLTAAGCIREPRLCHDTPGSWLILF